ncbi:MAG: hypothetical protein R6V06_10560 [Kiritimatiellia bacterium]
MKKLMMVAAAMTIAGGAFAQCGYEPGTPGQPEPGLCALVYSVKLTAKTTVAKFLKGQIVSGSGTVCGYGEEGYETDPVIYRKPGKVKLQGYWMNCSCDCTEYEEDMSAFDSSWLWLWEKRSNNYWFNDGIYGVDDTPAITKYWDSTASEPLVDLGAPVERGVIQWGPAHNLDGYGIVRNSYYGENIRNPFNLIGKKNNQVEAFWNIDRVFALPQYIGTVMTVPPRAVAIYAAGIGRFNSKNGVMRGISGNFAGLIDAPYYISKDLCEPAVAFDCCSCDALPNQSVFYGNWAMKYNASLSKLAVEDASRIYTSKCPQGYDNKDFRTNDFRWDYAM